MILAGKPRSGWIANVSRVVYTNSDFVHAVRGSIYSILMIGVCAPLAAFLFGFNPSDTTELIVGLIFTAGIVSGGLIHVGSNYLFKRLGWENAVELEDQELIDILKERRND